MIFQIPNSYNFFYNFNTVNDRPPFLYSLLNSLINYGKIKQDRISVYELAEKGREKVFNFNYPLTEKINKKDFEIMILNKFMNRRIGYETFTSWQIQLSVKMNEIMPIYNLLFDSLDGWDLFNDGEITKRKSNTDNSAENTANTKSTTTNHNIEDRRNSDTPQNYIEDVKNGNYVSKYQYNTTDTEVNDTSSSDGKSKSNSLTDEIIERTPADKISIYKEFLEARENIYTMIFNDLDSLFYKLID